MEIKASIYRVEKVRHAAGEEGGMDDSPGRCASVAGQQRVGRTWNHEGWRLTRQQRTKHVDPSDDIPLSNPGQASENHTGDSKGSGMVKAAWQRQGRNPAALPERYALRICTRERKDVVIRRCSTLTAV